MILFNKKSIEWEQEYSKKLFFAFIIVIFVVFGLRLWYLQVLRGDYFAQKSVQNKIRLQKIYAPRGLIFDRKQTLLAYNEPAYDLAIVREDCKAKNCSATLKEVSEILNVPPQEIQQKFQQGIRLVKSFDPLILIFNLSFQQLASIEARSFNLPALKIIVRPRRKYNYSEELSHVLGYVGVVSEKELQADASLDSGDYIGKGGIEKSYDEILRGKKGLKELEVDAFGRTLKQKVLQKPIPGRNLTLSLDLNLQKKIYSLVKDKAAAIVVMQPDTGQVLALVSSPGYDINKFVLGVKPNYWHSLLNNPLFPLRNKVIQGTYPPGSVFKLVIAGYLLQKQPFFSPDEKIFCPGYLKLGRRIFRCWKKYGHGWVDLKRALVESCDVYFYTQAKKIDIDKLHDFVLQCGFGHLTGIALPFEKSGFFPSRSWKLRRFGIPWQGGETLNVSIGQGYVLVTPLQVAVFISALINGGYLYKPSLLLDKKKLSPQKIPIDQANRQKIIQAMIATVNNPHGTARRIKLDGVVLGAKTGTAQVVKMFKRYEKKKLEEIPYKYRDHAWLATFGLIGQKKYVVVCLVEHGGHGASGCGPIVKPIYQYLLARSKEN